MIGASLMRNLFEGVLLVLEKAGHRQSAKYLGPDYDYYFSNVEGSDYNATGKTARHHSFVHGNVHTSYTWFCDTCNSDLKRLGKNFLAKHIANGIAVARRHENNPMACPTVIVVNHGLHHAHMMPLNLRTDYTSLVVKLLNTIRSICPSSLLLWQYTEPTHYDPRYTRHGEVVNITKYMTPAHAADVAEQPVDPASRSSCHGDVPAQLTMTVTTHSMWKCRSELRVFALNEAARDAIARLPYRVELIDAWSLALSRFMVTIDSRHYNPEFCQEHARVLLAEIENIIARLSQ